MSLLVCFNYTGYQFDGVFNLNSVRLRTPYSQWTRVRICDVDGLLQFGDRAFFRAERTACTAHIRDTVDSVNFRKLLKTQFLT